jgi:hypothetical protein
MAKAVKALMTATAMSVAMDIISLLYNLSDLIGIFRKLKTQLEFIDDVILYEYKKFTMTSPSSDLC